ncbi:hypothetical protein RSOLAG22IIIB_07484 [Rhizoctonia solani]|uniref:Laminin domain protein n=1 Tax=Rhizoctonia solani TaxID=456999 RepID=A0A0K6FND1_9AGAM|nr:hypothetical protein RSOLAG22IIIB_07484 [Rhizoctonia solani]
MSNLNQVLSPPVLPPYLESVHKLKPIVGEPSDDDVIKIHAIVQVASKVVDVRGMGDPLLLLQLSEHLFNVQMAKYRSRYLRAVFPENTTYTPPILPVHVSVNLEPVTGVPPDEAVIKVQDAIRGYQQFSNVPSMFDPRINMNLSQHLFDLQMARYTQRANESQPTPQRQETTRPTGAAQIIGAAEAGEVISATNNAGTGANTIPLEQTTQPTPGLDIRELLERSNRLADRFNQLLERSNELAARPVQPTEEPNGLAEGFNQALERISQLIEHACRPTEQSNQLVEHFNQLFDRFNQLAEQSNRSAQRANELLERIAPSSATEYYNTIQTNQPMERLGDILRNINGVLVGIQHAIVRNNKNNSIEALDCLVNDRGETPALSFATKGYTFRWFTHAFSNEVHRLPVVINAIPQFPLVPDPSLGKFLCFYGIGYDLLEDSFSGKLKEGKEKEAREFLSKYLSSCIG